MHIGLFRIFIIFVVLSCLPDISKADSLKSKIAVLDFDLCGDTFTTDELGSMVAEWFVTSLVKDGRFEVVERALLQKILAEQQLGTTGVIDDSSASKIGKILGVKIVVTGSVLNLGKKMEINSRMINVEDGTIDTAENIKCSAGADLQKVVEDLTGKIVKNFPLTGYVVKKDKSTVIIDLGKGAGVHPGMDFFVFKEGNPIKHPKTGEVLDIEQVHTGHIKISQIHGNVAEAAILKEEAGGIEYGQLVKSIQSKKMNSARSLAETNVDSKKTGEEGGRIVDSPVFDESEKNNQAGDHGGGKTGFGQKEKSLERSPSRNAPGPGRQLVASAPECQQLLKTWQLGDASVMQKYLKECSK